MGWFPSMLCPEAKRTPRFWDLTSVCVLPPSLQVPPSGASRTSRVGRDSGEYGLAADLGVDPVGMEEVGRGGWSCREPPWSSV
jgi:hypothetical protein